MVQVNILAAVSAVAKLRPALLILALILAAMVLSCIVFTVIYARSNKGGKLLLGMLYAVTLITLVCTLLCFYRYNALTDTEDTSKNTTGFTQSSTQQTTDNTTVEATTLPEEIPEPTYEPGYTDKSNPENWGIQWEIIQNGSIVDSYEREDPIFFGDGSSYTALEGVISFRGDNYRSGATYGTANVVNETISTLWSANIGSYNTWPGSGWTGQPLIVRWDDATKAIMNMYEEKKAKAGLVEVIHATLDGYVYFYDLEDGSYTRDPLWVGMNFKGAGTLDPRGYPLMYVGSGDYVSGKAPRMYIISLIDGSILYERSGSDSFTKRSDWAAFDSTPLISADTDTLIWPGESGILYTIKLNSQFDLSAGTISIAPEETVKSRYTTSRSGGRYWLGYEPSAVIVGSYLYISENGGMFFCVDLNTMSLVWAQDTKDDSNSTPVFQWDENGQTGYIYTAPSLHWTADGNKRGNLSIYKLNAKTGEIVWEYKYDCHTVTDVSGGVQSTPLLGKKGTALEGMIIYSIARTPNAYNGELVALDTQTGEVVWKMSMESYTWSSPVAVYGESGKVYVVICDSVGNVFLLNASTGDVLSSINIGSNVEASPAVFNDTIVVGTRGQKVYGIKVE